MTSSVLLSTSCWLYFLCRCVDNSYGDNHDREAVASARCTACPPHMYTDEFWGGAAPDKGFTDQSACKVDAGWGMTEGSAETCEVGFYNPGLNRLPCTTCPTGYTTLGTGASSIGDCVIRPGWFYDTAQDLPAPCDAGSWSSGGTAQQPEPSSCTACDTGYTTQEQESERPADCAGEVVMLAVSVRLWLLNLLCVVLQLLSSLSTSTPAADGWAGCALIISGDKMYSVQLWWRLGLYD
jgi:hypothetical protein